MFIITIVKIRNSKYQLRMEILYIRMVTLDILDFAHLQKKSHKTKKLILHQYKKEQATIVYGTRSRKYR